MAQTVTLGSHLTAMSDELKAALQKRDADAKVHINAAIQHAQAANAELKTQAAAGNAKAKQQAEQTMKHLDELIENGKVALTEAGNALHERVDTMIAHAKKAIQSNG